MSDKIDIIVEKYSPRKLIEIFLEYPKDSDKLKTESSVIKSFHNQYWKSYFKFFEINDGNSKSPITIVIETNYIDRHFLEDYAAFYSRCFLDIPKRCTRLHFFNLHFTKSDLISLLEDSIQDFPISLEIIKKEYLGFIVVKPLPETIIGRTCLATYNKKVQDERRNYPATIIYKVNFFGIKLSVESLPFQQQDRVAAACATSALWTVLHGTGMVFHHSIPSPVTITQSATKNMPLLSRVLPSRGLPFHAIVQAIRSVDLEPEGIPLYINNIQNDNAIEIKKEQMISKLKACVLAYLQGGIPFILAGHLYDTSIDKYIGLHAVAVTGYRLDGDLKEIKFHNDDYGLLLKSSKISELYVHDDQVGPFAKIIFIEKIFNTLAIK